MAVITRPINWLRIINPKRKCGYCGRFIKKHLIFACRGHEASAWHRIDEANIANQWKMN